MRHRVTWPIALAALLLAPVAWGAAAKPKPKGTPGKIVIKSNGPSEGPLRGPWQWTKGVTVTSEGLTLTCDTLTAWPGKEGRDFDRLEAVGNVHVVGTYTVPGQSTAQAEAATGRAAADAPRSTWDVEARASRVALDNITGLATLTGGVTVHGVNTVDKSALSAQADTFTYNLKTDYYRFERAGERGAGQQVQMEFQPAPPKAAVKPASATAPEGAAAK